MTEQDEPIKDALFQKAAEKKHQDAEQLMNDLIGKGLQERRRRMAGEVETRLVSEGFLSSISVYVPYDERDDERTYAWNRPPTILERGTVILGHVTKGLSSDGKLSEQMKQDVSQYLLYLKDQFDEDINAFGVELGNDAPKYRSNMARDESVYSKDAYKKFLIFATDSFLQVSSDEERINMLSQMTNLLIPKIQEGPLNPDFSIS